MSRPTNLEPSQTVRIASYATPKDILAAIDGWAAQNADTIHTRRLWDILTALRGPDNGDSLLKYETTAVIRQAALPQLAADNALLTSHNPHVLKTRIQNLAQFRGELKPEELDHFRLHIIHAAESIMAQG